ncbi:PREDICTED: uncharacterized protein LOC108358130 [Rhagoletis zephyria]|uniref:uncharacterized protein LOC108358130 n=1 Tax=Rhagoletis zephyria TaxID=28612 RepID=UPI00081165C7|nr:PREDICTED: uncharacterized protein LOC108358130 [Rhagoletis zephyria]XP_017464790.1 PREDICTED: uncharacterized protein LOC108358130 [Rhagoletis zephyria]XP_017464791.1 PREDICTED: uncharacterized protein LOC108358130 [Rhagoletis zephyria]
MAFQRQHLAIGICLLLLHSAVAVASAKADAKEAVAAKEIQDNKKKAEFPEEDTDMLMEPNDFTPVTVLRSQEQQFHVPPTYHFRSIPPHSNPHVIARADVHPAAPQPSASIDSHTQAAQNYYPPFFREAPPLGHSRPYFPIPDSPAIPKFAAPHPEQVPLGPTQRSFDPAILGSGDFGVLRGGTFYPEEEMSYHTDENSDFNQYYGDPNGHGRPSNEEFVQKYTYPEEQFADFRDFADINTPADSAFSQFVVVYAAKNSTKPSTHPRPKNIFEQLELFDREKEQEEKKRRASKSKSKLSKTKLQKKYKKKTSPKDVDYEPLLALS